MKVTLGVSNRHVHLTKEDYHTLFGDAPFEVVRPLVQGGEFASNSFVSLKLGEKVLSKVRVIGPLRSYTQVEISMTDARFFKIMPPVRESGDLEGALPITIVGPLGEVEKPCVILANRHIHMNHQTRCELGLTGVNQVSVHFDGLKETTFHNVFIKEKENGVLELHLDTDDANGALLKSGDTGEIIVESDIEIL